LPTSLRRRLLLALAMVVVPAGHDVARAADGFVVIVHPSVAGTRVKRADLAAVFLKKAVRWGSGGGLATPVDQSGTSPVRKAFCEAVIQQPVAEVVQYWQKQMFSASPLRPPPVKNSDAEVIAFVAKTPGAVGYVLATSSLPPEVRTLELVE
jgi:ABC-type phosphate transport system substrate-binding protein